MKILLATDGSPCSEAAVGEVCRRPWPAGSEVKVLSVASIPFPTEKGETYVIEDAYRLATEVAERTAQRIRAEAPALRAQPEMINGLPKQVILEEAERWRADLILMGSHGYGPVQRFLLGSVSQAVALHAPCSVEIVRCRPPEDAAAAEDVRVRADSP